MYYFAMSNETGKCPNCGSPIKDDDKFCGKCGFNLFKKCYRCGKEISVSNRFCPHCGTDNSIESITNIKKEKSEKQTHFLKILILLFGVILLSAIVIIAINIHNNKEQMQIEERAMSVIRHYQNKGTLYVGVGSISNSLLQMKSPDELDVTVRISLQPEPENAVKSRGSISLHYIPIVESNYVFDTKTKFNVQGHVTIEPDELVFANKVINGEYNQDNKPLIPRDYSTVNVLRPIAEIYDSTQYKYRCQGSDIYCRLVVADLSEPIENSIAFIRVDGVEYRIPW